MNAFGWALLALVFAMAGAGADYRWRNFTDALEEAIETQESNTHASHAIRACLVVLLIPSVCY